jgi:hypothetical protein
MKNIDKYRCSFVNIEMHRTQTDFDNHFTIKVFIFQFINIYSSIFYIAFIKGKSVESTRPMHIDDRARTFLLQSCRLSGQLLENLQSTSRRSEITVEDERVSSPIVVSCVCLVQSGRLPHGTGHTVGYHHDR